MKRFVSALLAVLVAAAGIPALAETCAHEHTQAIELENWDSIVVLNSDAKGHTIEMEVYEVLLCQDCDEEISSKTVGKKTLTEEHRYYNGVCSACGRISSCPHTNTSYSEEAVNVAAVTHRDEKGHSLIVIYVSTLVCEDCGDIMETTRREAAVEGPHEYDEPANKKSSSKQDLSEENLEK